MPRAANREAGFAVSVFDQRMIEEGALERFEHDEEFSVPALEAGYVDKEGEITQKGWDVLSDDIAKFERNALAWLRKNFVSASDQGHDSHDDLVGNVVWNPRSKKQRELLALGQRERIDSDVVSYGDFADTAWKGCSRFSIVLSGAINFFDTGIDEHTGKDL